jgi:hypothetical protein
MSAFLFPECPEHKEELRIEYGHTGRSGYCAKCARHYSLCTNTLYTSICQQLQGHEGKHRDDRRRAWD